MCDVTTCYYKGFALNRETVMVSNLYDRHTISSVNISCNILYVVIRVPKRKAPIYEIGALPGKNHPCSAFARRLKLSIRKTPCQAETSFLGRFLNLSGEGQVTIECLQNL